jgi:2-keto-4-pentenoate hydratase/2-oxohepta-3-ene-1,7-dioic acid hydratase in catechol pathway
VRIVRFSHEGVTSWGRLEGDTVRTTAGPSTLAEIALASASDLTTSIPLDAVALRAPVLPDTKILCVGLNYRDHVLETGRDLPEKPVIFTRFPDSLVGPGEAVVIPAASHRLDFEAELAVVIGKEGRAISTDRALDHVLGYTVLNDGSVRDFQRHTGQFTPGKNFVGSGAVGPWITTADEVGELGPQRIELRIDGEVMQSSTLDQLIFGVPELIAYISTFTVLRPGDIIATGTPGGVGVAREPRRWLQPGERVEISLERVGVLENPVVAERG